MCRAGHLRKIHLFLVNRHRRRIYEPAANTFGNLNCGNKAAVEQPQGAESVFAKCYCWRAEAVNYRFLLRFEEMYLQKAATKPSRG